MAIHIGTSGWHYAHWKAVFYPQEAKTAQWLEYYASQLNCVEINNSFYRLPDKKTFQQWSAQTPASFRFCVKAPRTITHLKKLKDCQAVADKFLDHASALDKKLGAILFQLPPHWRCNTSRLEDFIARLPTDYRYTFEFRDPRWHNDEVYELLKKYRAAFCIFELGELKTPIIETTDFIYIRLHGPQGPYSGSYHARTLRMWAERLCHWQKKRKDVYLFFDNDEQCYAVKNALLTQRLIKELKPNSAQKRDRIILGRD